MTVFVGIVRNDHINTSDEIEVFVDRCEMKLVIHSAGACEEKAITKGSTIVDPTSDDEMTVIAATGNGIYAEDHNGKRHVLPAAETIRYNFAA